jgi:hypothetical protein
MPLVLLAMAMFLLCSCKKSYREAATTLVNEWKDKVVVYPEQWDWVSYRRDTVQKYSLDYDKYVIIAYMDSIGCMSCRMNLPRWSEWINTVDSVSNYTVPHLIIIHPSQGIKPELVETLKRTRFTYPVCIDETDAFNRLNKFPSRFNLCTLLIDKAGKVLLIGDPINNPNMRRLFLHVVEEKDIKEFRARTMPSTTVVIEQPVQSLGSFNWLQPKQIAFKLKNIGHYPLKIADVITSCSCTTVQFSKEDVVAGKEAELLVHYQADNPESVDTTIKVYGNFTSSPLILRITGDAQE